MPDICIYYSKEDKQRVEWLDKHLKNMGWDIWWYDYNSVGKWNSCVETKTKESKCVIPIWTETSINPEKTVVNEAQFARDHEIPILPIRMDDVILPIQFNYENTTDIIDWDGNSIHQGINELKGKLIHGVGLEDNKQSQWDGNRLPSIDLSGKIIKLPCFVKSLSSHETQLDPEAGLTVISLFPGIDALLVSAYDMCLPEELRKAEADKEKEKITNQHRLMCEQLEHLDQRGVLILLDSGNYEKSRKEDNNWTEEKFHWVLKNVPYTYAFCFDNLTPSINPVENARDVIARVKGEFENSLIPILHAPINENGLRNHETLPNVFFEYASRKDSPIIAVPERELGEGICQKVKTVVAIRKKLNTLGRYQPIHLLGTGNPLSISILSAAGADLFDGLEWCRTVADRDTGFLFHHQQFDFFQTQSMEMARYGIVREAMQQNDISLSTKMGLHNLDFFLEWMEELQSKIHEGGISDMIKYRAVFGTHDFVNELNKLMPELFK